ncbi:MAG: rRNA ((1402)-N(4))-methyltransferase RsmH [Bacteroidota bacterium]|jgi:16S rRNA (cytosine1402-N4)-methyltransferase
MPNEQKRDRIGEEGNRTYHVPVMLKEAVDSLSIKPDGVYVDCTYGGGGHSREILSKLNENGRLYAFDQDPDAKANLTADTRLVFIPHNFRHLARFLRLYQVQQVDGILADLGVSSHQFDEPSRGFSIRFDAPLDMRMDNTDGVTAAELIKQSSAEELQWIFQEFGEVTNAKTLANLLVEQVRSQTINTVNDLKNVIAPIVKGNPNKYFAQVFQALRMKVNDEVGALADLMQQAADVLKPEGRFSVITFHSIEDRLVKNFFKTGSVEEQEVDPVYGTRQASPFVLMNKKPIEPSFEEVKSNPRSRSARLRVGIKK